MSGAFSVKTTEILRLDDTWSIDSEGMQPTLEHETVLNSTSLHLTLEILHDIQKPIVHFRLFVELKP